MTPPQRVSILLVQWITLEVAAFAIAAETSGGFNPSGSMDYFGRRNELETRVFPYNIVSILLVQWITLEGHTGREFNVFIFSFNPSGSMDYFGSCIFEAHKQAVVFSGFNPSGSMDYFGSVTTELSTITLALFQSFWFNGLLWKIPTFYVLIADIRVSILLVQWITLEDGGLCQHLLPYYKFQSFWVNGLLWKLGQASCTATVAQVSILLGQWITLEALDN